MGGTKNEDDEGCIACCNLVFTKTILVTSVCVNTVAMPMITQQVNVCECKLCINSDECGSVCHLPLWLYIMLRNAE